LGVNFIKIETSFFFSGGNGSGTQGFTLAKQVLYHLPEPHLQPQNRDTFRGESGWSLKEQSKTTERLVEWVKRKKTFRTQSLAIVESEPIVPFFGIIYPHFFLTINLLGCGL
jgi:hypothetical protein